MKHSFAILISLCAYGAIAQSTEFRQQHYNIEDGAALSGFDPVSYWEEDGPRKGKSSLTYRHQGITYYFSSSENLNLFRDEPGRYEPQYGGWCAYAMGNDGTKVEINPKTYKLLDDRLYLFYNAYFTNTLPKWNKDERELKRKADLNWDRIRKK